MSDRPPAPALPPDQSPEPRELEREEIPKPASVPNAPTDVRLEIIARLARKGGGDPLCPVCHTNNFAVGGFVHLDNSVVAEPRIGTPPRHYPLIAVYCTNCGATQLVNLLILGFTPEELVGMRVTDQDSPRSGDAAAS